MSVFVRGGGKNYNFTFSPRSCDFFHCKHNFYIPTRNKSTIVIREPIYFTLLLSCSTASYQHWMGDRTTGKMVRKRKRMEERNSISWRPSYPTTAPRQKHLLTKPRLENTHHSNLTQTQQRIWSYTKSDPGLFLLNRPVTYCIIETH